MGNRRITVVRPSQMFDSFVDDFFNNAPAWNQGAFSSVVDINIQEKEDKVLVSAKIPGFEKDEINIHVEENMLVIEGVKKAENVDGNEDGEYYIREFSSQNIKRSVSLPTKVDGEKADAEIKNGILKVTLPKLPDVMPKKIAIKSA
jgi:HSP20 family protein